MLASIRRFVRRCRRGTASSETSQQRPHIGIQEEVDYFALASYLIDHYGTDARAQAVRLTQDALQEDDALAVTDWLAVEQAIALLADDAAAARH